MWRYMRLIALMTAAAGGVLGNPVVVLGGLAVALAAQALGRSAPSINPSAPATDTASAPPDQRNVRSFSINPADDREAAIFEVVWTAVPEPIRAIYWPPGPTAPATADPRSRLPDGVAVRVVTGHYVNPLFAWGHHVDLAERPGGGWAIVSTVAFMA